MFSPTGKFQVPTALGTVVVYCCFWGSQAGVSYSIDPPKSEYCNIDWRRRDVEVFQVCDC
jgi:hypothetical protein